MMNFRNFAHDEPDDPFCQFQIEIAERDRAIVESQRPEELPADLTAELHVRATGQDVHRVPAVAGRARPGDGPVTSEGPFTSQRGGSP